MSVAICRLLGERPLLLLKRAPPRAPEAAERRGRERSGGRPICGCSRGGPGQAGVAYGALAGLGWRRLAASAIAPLTSVGTIETNWGARPMTINHHQSRRDV